MSKGSSTAGHDKSAATPARSNTEASASPPKPSSSATIAGAAPRNGAVARSAHSAAAGSACTQPRASGCAWPQAAGSAPDETEPGTHCGRTADRIGDKRCRDRKTGGPQPPGVSKHPANVRQPQRSEREQKSNHVTPRRPDDDRVDPGRIRHVEGCLDGQPLVGDGMRLFRIEAPGMVVRQDPDDSLLLASSLGNLLQAGPSGGQAARHLQPHPGQQRIHARDSRFRSKIWSDRGHHGGGQVGQRIGVRRFQADNTVLGHAAAERRSRRPPILSEMRIERVAARRWSRMVPGGGRIRAAAANRLDQSQGNAVNSTRMPPQPSS